MGSFGIISHGIWILPYNILYSLYIWLKYRLVRILYHNFLEHLSVFHVDYLGVYPLGCSDVSLYKQWTHLEILMKILES